MTIKFPYWVKVTPCEFRTNTRVWPRGKRYGSIHGAVRITRRTRVK